ncbi:MAG: 5-formyltetrahydrofolate cyclo-ligase [Chlamydiales bacterium]
MESLLIKNSLRKFLKTIRKTLPPQRQEEAAQALKDHLLPLLTPYHSVLSFWSLCSEINTSHINQCLAVNGQLLLPKVEDQSLTIYRIEDIEQQLYRGKFGIHEPIPEKCEQVKEVEIALIPALGFDFQNNRIGYGKGYYDRFLSSMNCLSIGVGFKEQMIPSIPIENQDIPLSQIELF